MVYNRIGRSMRTDNHGNETKATEFGFQRIGDVWGNDARIIIHSESFFPDGSAYKPAGVEPDRVLVSYLVAKGILELEEAEEIKRLLTKIYEGVGNDNKTEEVEDGNC